MSAQEESFGCALFSRGRLIARIRPLSTNVS
jgi:hypothetical protein